MAARRGTDALAAAARSIDAAVDATLRNPATRTADLGGKIGTREFAKAVDGEARLVSSRRSAILCLLPHRKELP